MTDEREQAGPMTHLSVDFEWELLGVVELDAALKISFPKDPTAPHSPGLYRLWIESGDERPGVYIGEAGDLRRRLQHYRTPGACQATNLRTNGMIKRTLVGGGRVTVWIATAGQAQFGPGISIDLDLHRKNQRLVLEQAAIAATLLAEDLVDEDDAAPLRLRLLNRPGVGEEEYA